MALHLVIDGYNLLHASSPGAFGDIEAERERLIDGLAAYRRLKRVRLTAIFDGTASGRLSRSREMRSGIEVVFSRDGEEADRILKELAREKKGSVTIVTSDRDVASYAEANGAVTIGSEEFRNLLDLALYEDLKGVKTEDEDETAREKKGPSRREPKAIRRKMNRLKKL
ncbi:MAG: NYN domain-containing protein [Deltaproteobacteria bacterium]|nr:NYN domain-containing protein [Deltaproteobacteria bacterium]